MKAWQLQVLKKINQIKYGLVLINLAPIIDLIDLFIEFVPPPKNRGFSAALTAVIGIVFISLGKDFGARPNVRRSFFAVGAGFVILGITNLNRVTVNLVLGRVLTDCLAIFLFLASYYYASKAAQDDT